jgi:hypothetical protein
MLKKEDQRIARIRTNEELGIFKHEHHERHELLVSNLSFVRVGLCGSWFIFPLKKWCQSPNLPQNR